MKIHVTDLNGCSIEVPDLDEAIEQADWFKDCHHIPPRKGDEIRQEYWRDMYEKLITLKSKEMSNLAKTTEYKALSILAQMVKQFERLHYLDMAKTDDCEATKARNLLEGIIQSNGYKINYERNTKKSLLKSEL